jgi:hypothetical protein
MKRRRKFSLELAVGLLALAFAALPALAQAANVTLHEGSKTGPNLAVEAEVEAASSNLVFSTEIGALECGVGKVSGVVAANSAEPADVQVEEGQFEEVGGGACKTSIPLPGGVTAHITPENFPWVIHFFANGTTTITGAAFEATLTNALGEDIATCTYSAASIADTFNFNTALFDTITGQTLTGGGTSLCPSSGTLSGKFAVTHNGNAVVATTP